MLENNHRTCMYVYDICKLTNYFLLSHSNVLQFTI